MHLPTHLILSWLVGHRLQNRRDRVIVAWAGVAPDLDALTALAGIEVYGTWHHVLTHGITAVVVLTALWTWLARSKLPVAALSALTFHLHLVCDLLGSGVQWGIKYLYPFSSAEIFTPYGWSLASWQNVAITVVGMTAAGWIGVRRGRTFAETFLPAAGEAAVVEALQRRFVRNPTARPVVRP